MESAALVLENLTCNQLGLTRLGGFAGGVYRNLGKRIVVDCSLVSFIEANIAAALGAIKAYAEALGSIIEFQDLAPDIKTVLIKNGFFPSAGISPARTIVPLKNFSLSEAKEFAIYTTDEFKKQNMPRMSEGLQQKFFEGIDEIFNNCSIHSKSPVGIFACGQSYPKTNLFDFSIVDLGVGFRENVEKYLKIETTASDAINWAMQLNNTTRQGDVPGGLGLDILKNFIKINEGRLTVYSDSGFWSLTSNGVINAELRNRFPGTFINLEIRTKDPYVYYLENETIDPNSVL